MNWQKQGVHLVNAIFFWSYSVKIWVFDPPRALKRCYPSVFLINFKFGANFDLKMAIKQSIVFFF